MKVFRNKDDFSMKILRREMDVLSKINHENIVKIFGVETDYGTGKPILIMEFLNRGTLYDQLLEPEHLNGFSDPLFLYLLKDVAAGLTQLQISGIVHRDIKPNNILRSIMLEGRDIYKLSDFGGAKKVSNEDTMESIVGTEEYAHPAVYEKAFINKRAEMTSSRHLDEWSLGITLYHVATGKIPFQTKEGRRKNRKCRLEMLKWKPSGVISAIENENGEIIWEKELPSTCMLSRSLSKLIRDSICGLLESKSKKASIIPDFLADVEKILMKVPVHVIQPSQERLEIFYLNPWDKIPHLKEEIAQEWDIPGHEQLLFHGCIDLTLPFHSKNISEYPPTRPGHPVILIEKNLIKNDKVPDLSIETISFPEEISSKDSFIAAQICSQIFKMKEAFHRYNHINDCMMYTVGILNSMVGSEIRNMELLMNHFSDLVLEKEHISSLESVNSLKDFVGYPNIEKQYKKIKNLFNEAGEILKHIRTRKLKKENIHYQTTERKCLESIFQTVKADFEKHKNLIPEVREDFHKWLSQKLVTHQKISNLKTQLMMSTPLKRIHLNAEMDKRLQQQTKELIAISRKEAHRLSALNSDILQLVSSNMSYI